MDEQIEKEFISKKPDVVEVNQNGNLDGICRLCGNYDSQLMSTFSGAGISNYLYRKIIEHLTAIKISKSDNLPSQICYQCISTLITWDDLFEACLEVDKRLRRILKRMESKKTANSNNSSITTNVTDSALGGSSIAVADEAVNSYNFGNNEVLDLDIMNVDFSDIANLDDFSPEELALSTPNFDYDSVSYGAGQEVGHNGDMKMNSENFYDGMNDVDTTFVENETSPFLFQSYDTKRTTFLPENFPLTTTAATTSMLPLENINIDSSDLLLLANDLGQMDRRRDNGESTMVKIPFEENLMFKENL